MEHKPPASSPSDRSASTGDSSFASSPPREADSGFEQNAGLDDVTPPDAKADFQHAIEPENEPSSDAANASSPHMSTHLEGKASNGGASATQSADREYLAEQVIGQTPLLPPRQPLGARMATLMGRRHGVLLALCTLALWAAMTLRPPVQGENFRRGAVASQDILAPRAATLPDRKLTEARKREAAALVPAVYDGNPDALAFALSRLRTIAAARRDLSTSLSNGFPPGNAPAATTPSSQTAASSAGNAASVRTAKTTSQPLSPQATSSHAGSSSRMSTHAGGQPSSSGASSLSGARSKSTVSEARQKALDDSARRLNERLQNDETHRELPFDAARRAVAIAPERWLLVENTTQAAIRAAYSSGESIAPIRSDHLTDDLVAAWRRMRAEAMRQKAINRLSNEEATSVGELARDAVNRPNLLVNARKTALARQEARNGVNAVSRDIKLGDVLVSAGTVIDDDKWALLQDIDLVASRFDASLALARLALCFVLVAFGASYVARFHADLMNQPASLWLAAFVPVAFVAFFRGLLRVPGGDGAMVPLVATGAMLLTILLDARIGLLGAFIMTALCATMAHADSGLYLATLLGASVGVVGVSDISSRISLVRAAAVLALTNVTLCVAIGVLRGTHAEQTLVLATWAAAAGGLSVVVTYCLVMFLERPFGITTHLRLLELSAPDETVMRRMQAEAPGTYTHSLMVAQLSEVAAKEVGADALLCRVGGLYHDIGKLRRPHCFIENQSGDNVHDRLSPQMSALLIVAHVKDGLELGRALQLPQPVLDIIAQHHGTTLISYFYHRAARENVKHQSPHMSTHAEEESRNITLNGANTRVSNASTSASTSAGTSAGSDAAEIVSSAIEAAEASQMGAPRHMDESLFRYPGPRPQSKEAAIVLLADTIEASSRALPDITPERLEEHIKEMVAARLAGGELAECELTLRDLGTIERSFAHVLRGVLHQRIAYPDPTRDLREDAAFRPPARDWMRGSRAASVRAASERISSDERSPNERRPAEHRVITRLPRIPAPYISAQRDADEGTSHSAFSDRDIRERNRIETPATSQREASDRRRAEEETERRGNWPDRRRARRQAAEIINARDITASVLTAHLNHHAKTPNLHHEIASTKSGSAEIASTEPLEAAREHHLEQSRAPLPRPNSNGFSRANGNNGENKSGASGDEQFDLKSGTSAPESFVTHHAQQNGASRDAGVSATRAAQNSDAAPTSTS